jgi:hypothetical protein
VIFLTFREWLSAKAIMVSGGFATGRVPFLLAAGLSSADPTIMALPPDFPLPTLSIWEQTKHPWIDLPEGIQHFERARV